MASPLAFLKSPPRSPALSPGDADPCGDDGTSSSDTPASSGGEEAVLLLAHLRSQRDALEDRIRVLEMSHDANAGLVDALRRLHSHEMYEATCAWHVSEEESFRNIAIARRTVDSERRRNSLEDVLRAAVSGSPPCAPPPPPLDPHGLRTWLVDVAARQHALSLDVRYNILLLRRLQEESDTGTDKRRQRARKMAELKATIKRMGEDLRWTTSLLQTLQYGANVLVSNGVDVGGVGFAGSLPTSQAGVVPPASPATPSVTPPRLMGSPHTQEASQQTPPVCDDVCEDVDDLHACLSSAGARLEDNLRLNRSRQQELQEKRAILSPEACDSHTGAAEARLRRKAQHLSAEEGQIMAALSEVRQRVADLGPCRTPGFVSP